MPRYALKIEYHGKPFVGWQRQPKQKSVQGTIEAALSKLEPRIHNIVAAGRTDAGVHALAQVVHCDMAQIWNPFRLSEALNYHLRPNPIAVIGCNTVANNWHARFFATERQYQFRILMRRAPATHLDGLVWQIKNQLNIEAMRKGAQHLLGQHDFTTFRSSICQAESPIKTVDVINVSQVEGGHGQEVRFDVRARSFLHNQVRSFVGTLVRVGNGSMQPTDVKYALEACDRSACGQVSPPQGLYLANVIYPDDPFKSEQVQPKPHEV